MGASDCTPCAAGYECPTPTSVPKACTQGYYSLAGQTNCTLCPANHRCPSVNVAPILCDIGVGEYSLLGQFDCSDCPQGQACEVLDGYGLFTVNIRECKAGVPQRWWRPLGCCVVCLSCGAYHMSRM